MSVEQQVATIEQQIAVLKEQRDALLKDSPMQQAQLQRILAIRAPQQTLCQLLRELHVALDTPHQAKVDQCLLIAKKMDAQLERYAGMGYAASWYDAQGRFRG